MPNVINPSVSQFAALTQQIADETANVNNGVRIGLITNGEAERLQAQLKVAQQGLNAAKSDGDGLTQMEGFAVGRHLNSIAEDVKAARNNGEVDSDRAVRSLQRDVARGQRNGTLTAEEAQQLSGRVQQLQGLSSAEQRDGLSGQVAAARGELRTLTRNDNFDPDARLADFQRRIDLGTSDGTLTSTEASYLQGQVDLLKSLSSQGVNIATSFNSLSQEIYKQRHDAQTNNQLRETSVAGRVDRAVSEGRVSTAEAGSLMSALAQLLEGGRYETGAQLNVIDQRLTAAIWS
jgi:hypothetical protein